jgi:dihydroflavonol-4-reductase
MKRAFVTGGTGVVGRAFLPRLAASGWEITALTRDPQKSGLPRSPAIHFHAGDLDSEATRGWLRRGEGNYDAVFHLAASLAYVDPRDRLFATNVGGTEAVAEFARRTGAKQFVYASSIEAAGAFRAEEIPAPIGLQHAPLTHYGASKIAAEQVALGLVTHGITATCARIGNVYGAGWKNLMVEFAEGLLTRDRLWEYLSVIGERYLSPVHADDVSAGLIAAESSRHHGIVNLTGQAATVEEIFRLCADVLGVPFTCGRRKLADRLYVHYSTRYLRKLWGHFDTLSYLALPAPPHIHRAVAMSESEALLKWSPAITLRAGIASTLTWARDTGLLKF